MLRGRQASAPELPSVAWFDEPDALDRVDDLASGEADRELLRSWVLDGYAIVPGLVPGDLIDEMLADLDGTFHADAPDGGLVFNDLVVGGVHHPTLPHAELLAVPEPERRAARQRSNWRLHGFFQHSPAADRIRELPELRRVASTILGLDSHALYSINFHNGSAQALHEDSAVFHLATPNLICGAWIACEDVVDGCGPLAFHPGSHRRGGFPSFADDPARNLRTASPEVSVAYRRYVEDAASDFEREVFLARKGDVLFWHGMLIHGGEPVRDASLTRRSYVLHFIPAGADVAHLVTGPTNW